MKPETDILIIGSGLSGLYCALHAAGHADVMILTQGTLTQSNSIMAQGGIAAVLDEFDSPQAHIEDTMIAGAELNDRKAVEILVKEGPEHIRTLVKWGVEFDQQNGSFDLTQEGGHSHRRIVHVKDATGHAIIQALLQKIHAHPRITIKEHHEVIALVTDTENHRVVGARVRHQKKESIIISQQTVLATGGSGQLYQHTTNPAGAIGSGVALAAQVGADISDMEFIQFHPTALLKNESPHFLLSESLRGEGAILRNEAGDRFMETVDTRLELAPRDIVSRAIFAQQKNGKVYLDFTHETKEQLQERFPTIYHELEEHGFYLEKDLVPVTPAAHYQCGGVSTDLNGKTSVEGLYAIGEVARTGVHGANRLASNSLLECLVFAARASTHIATQKKISEVHVPIIDEAETIHEESVEIEIQKQIQKIMWGDVGIIRTQEGLQHARKSLQQLLLQENLSLHTQMMLQTSVLIVQAAQARTESIGAHFLTK